MPSPEFFRFLFAALLGTPLVLWATPAALAQPPVNDDFDSATVIGAVPFTEGVDTSEATTEAGEPAPSCTNGGDIGRTVWYAFTSGERGSFSANSYDSWISPFVAVYTGSALDELTEVGCCAWGEMLTLSMEAGTIYYFQVGGQYGGGDWLVFNLDVAPQPEANFDFYPEHPSSFDMIGYYDRSRDPAGVGLQAWEWDFGDGTTATGDYSSHRYMVDGDYTVQLTAATWDGRVASVSRIVSVRTGLASTPPYRGWLVLDGTDDYAEAEDRSELDVGDESFTCRRGQISRTSAMDQL